MNEEKIEEGTGADVELLAAIDSTLEHDKSLPRDTGDSSMSTWLVSEVFKRRIAWNKEFGWLAFHGCVWQRITPETVLEVVRRSHESLHERFMFGGAGGTSLDASKVKQLLSTAKIKSVVGLLPGQVEIPAEKFDQRSELLNTPSGVVDLRTLELLAPDPSYLFTKITSVGYVPGAKHADIDELLTCLPEPERDWMCDRLGQAIIGTPPDEASMTLLVGFGANGKTSLMHVSNLALGTFFGRIPVSVLSASAKSGPNDTMTLRGVRMAVIEEFPEGHTVSNRNLKEIVGTPRMQGRYLFKEYVEWNATHTLFVTTNELPRVDETDHGTWRRFDVLSFPFRYVSGEQPLVEGDKIADPKLMNRIMTNRHGQLEALLALIVESANALFLRGKKPILQTPKMLADKESWRERSDKIYSFVTECVDFDEKCHVSASELYNVYVLWMEAQGNRPLSQSNFTSKFLEHELVKPHGVEKKRIRAGQWSSKLIAPRTVFGAGSEAFEPERYGAIRGLRYKD
ncbi:MAG: phage/plasmid primase, P4 family [Actinobacteria bacterium]|nr:phage/plasmid primase, P4 family [Actinomycetota bacterium]